MYLKEPGKIRTVTWFIYAILKDWSKNSSRYIKSCTIQGGTIQDRTIQEFTTYTSLESSDLQLYGARISGRVNTIWLRSTHLKITNLLR